MNPSTPSWKRPLSHTLRAPPRPYPVAPFSPGFRGELFHISHNNITKDGETTDERTAHLAKNTDYQRRRDEEVAHAADGDPNAPHRVYRNLDHEFNMVGNQLVEQT